MDTLTKNTIQTILKYRPSKDIVVSFGDDHFVNINGKNYGPYSTKEEAISVKNSLRDNMNKQIVNDLIIF